jgi:DDE superfamily endonuclease/Winged helix-turn helix
MDRGAAAKIGGVDRQTLRDWVHRFNASGPGGLLDDGTEGPKPRLSSAQMAEVAELLELAPLALPYADTDMMQLHLDEISRNVADGAHAVVRLDRAGWHTTGKLDMPKTITPIFLPSRAPELNPIENVWQYLRQTWLSNSNQAARDS